jgi:AmmeMemoRadiSam system protein B
MRKPMFAGSFYPKSADQLNKLLSDCFTAEKGPGAVPVQPVRPEPFLKAVIVPHAGYAYSGMCSAWGYNAISDSELPDVFVILAPSHKSGVSGISADSFETPIGIARPDQEFIKHLVAKGTFGINESIHVDEHSVEVQLPILQFSLGKRADGMKIVPILVSSDIDLDAAARDLIQVSKELKRKVTFIVSSDLTHYGRNYSYVPFSDDIPARLAKLDGELIEFIKDGDYKSFEKHVFDTGATVCGVLPIGLMLRTVKFSKANLEQYYTSGELTGDYKSSVSYATIVFK